MADLGRNHCIDPVLETRAIQLLELGIPYNKESSLDRLEDRFDVSPNIVLVNTFRILDRDCCVSVNIAHKYLKDLEFNLIEWYGAELLRIDLKESQAVLCNAQYR